MTPAEVASVELIVSGHCRLKSADQLCVYQVCLCLGLDVTGKEGEADT